MKEVIGILGGILVFLLLSSHIVNIHRGIDAPRLKTAHPQLQSHSSPLPPADSSSLPSRVPSSTEEVHSSQEQDRSPIPVPPLQAEPANPLTATPPSQVPPTFQRINRHPEKVIQFQSGCARLSRQARTALHALLPAFQQAPSRRIVIDGHTDDVGNKQFNQDLSRLRADAVRNYLVANGLAEARVTTRGNGASVPIADNRSAAGRRRNRRTEITFHHESPMAN